MHTTYITIPPIITEEKTESRREYQDANSRQDKRRARSSTPDHNRITPSTPQASTKLGIAM